MELMIAADTGDFLIACAFFHAKQHFAVRAFEIFVILPVFHSLDELAGFCFDIRGQRQVFPVFRQALFIVPGKHPEQGPGIQAEAQDAEQSGAEETGKQGDHEAGDQREETQVIGAVAALHETDKS